MAFANRVQETTDTTGTGTINLNGATSGHQTFVAASLTGANIPYLIEDGVDWEVGYGTVTDASPDTLARNTISASSNGGAAVNWGSGRKTVHNIIPAVVIDDLLTGSTGVIYRTATNTYTEVNFTAKGQLLAATAATTPTMLAAPSSNQVLVGDTTAATGFKWSATLAGLTLTTPTIADLTNMTHTHSNNAGGGTLTWANIFSAANAGNHTHASTTTGNTLTWANIFSVAAAGTHDHSSTTKGGTSLAGLNSVKIGQTSGYTVGTIAGNHLLISRIDGNISIQSTAWNNDTTTTYMAFGKSRGGALDNYTVINTGDVIGQIEWAGADGNDLASLAAKMLVKVAATPGADDMPGRWELYTTKDGANSPTEGIALDCLQNFIIGAGVDAATGGAAGMLIIKNGTLATTMATDCCGIYCVDVSTSSEMYTQDETEATNKITAFAYELFQPDPDEMLHFEQTVCHPLMNVRAQIDLTRALRLLERIAAERNEPVQQFIHYAPLGRTVTLEEREQRKRTAFCKNAAETYISTHPKYTKAELDTVIADADKEFTIKPLPSWVTNGMIKARELGYIN